jgi:hypothetical protein
VNRRLVITSALLGVLGAGLAAPALAASDTTDSGSTTICVQMPLNKPTDPKAPGYCIWIPGLAAAP